MKPLSTPVAIIVFKRLDATKMMFERVREARPRKLFIIADGWRSEEEKVKCLAVREYLESAIDWPCEVFKNYAPENLGCKKRVVSGLNWVFEQAESAIILEDDCVPDPTFFPFCEELLEKYRDEPRVMQISGLNTQVNQAFRNEKFSTGGASYYFSRFGEIWGWATWRRAWRLYDIHIDAWPQMKEEHKLERVLKDPKVVDYWEHMFDKIYRLRSEPRAFDAWAAMWVFANLCHDGLAAVPKTNLMENFGDDAETARAQYTVKDHKEYHYRRPVTPLVFPLAHPERIEVNEAADHFTLYEGGFRIKRLPREKILFALKYYTPWLHKTVKRIYKFIF